MDNIGPDEIFERLARLSEQERNVLRLRCQGLDYKTISSQLYVSKSAVKQYMARAYVKLGLDHLPRTQRIKALFETVCPVLQKSRLPPEPAIEIIEEPVPEPVEGMVDEDEYAIVPVRPPESPLSRPKSGNSRRGLRTGCGAILGVVLGICLCTAAGIFVFRPNIGSIPFISRPTATVRPPASKSTEITPQSPAPEIASQTPVIVENAAVTATSPATQAPTALPVAAISLPFSDNFGQGPSSSWRILSGNWITASGRFTVIGKDYQYNWLWAALDEPAWQNYRLTVNTNIAYPGAAAQGQLAIAVRMSNNQSEYLGFVVDVFLRGGWALIGTDEKDFRYLAGDGDSIPSTATIQLDAVGNAFTARINGQVYQTITLSGYDNGGIALGIVCKTELGKCPSFDDFKIEAISP